MDVTTIAAIASDMAQTEQAQQAQIALMKKAMNIQASNALQLIQVATQSTPVNPAHLGQNVDVQA